LTIRVISDIICTTQRRQPGEHVPMGELGDTLRQAREAKGLSLEQVEAATKIRSAYLQAMEEEAYERMPAPVYVRGFLKNYAQFLGLDVQEILSLNPDAEPAGPTDSIPPMLDEPLEPFTVRRWLRWALVPAIVAAAVVGWWGYQRYAWTIPFRSPTATPTASPIASRVQASPTVSTPTETTDPTRTATPTTTRTPTPTRVVLEMRVEIIGSRSWLLVHADGERVFAGILEPGATQTWTAGERLSLRSGNAGATRLVLNGEDLGLFGEIGAVLEHEWTAPGVPTSTPSPTATATSGA
jgi:cytoskeleton protein RodZ